MAEHPAVAWLEAELARVEELARAATPGPWSAKPAIYGRPQGGWGAPSDWEIKAPSGTVVSHQRYEGGGIYVEADALHIALHDPAAVLRRVAADRQILAEHQPTWSTGEPEYDYHREPVVGENGRTRYVEVINDDPIPPYWCGCCQAEAPCRTVRLLAEAYGWAEETR